MTAAEKLLEPGWVRMDSRLPLDGTVQAILVHGAPQPWLEYREAVKFLEGAFECDKPGCYVRYWRYPVDDPNLNPKS